MARSRESDEQSFENLKEWYNILQERENKEVSEQAQRIQEQQAELDKLKEVVERTPHLNRIVFLERRLDERRLRQEQLERALREALPYMEHLNYPLFEKIEALLNPKQDGQG